MWADKICLRTHCGQIRHVYIQTWADKTCLHTNVAREHYVRDNVYTRRRPDKKCLLTTVWGSSTCSDATVDKPDVFT